jgi:two-component system, OmpR family, sensor histidine kinase BaeS
MQEVIQTPPPTVASRQAEQPVSAESPVSTALTTAAPPRYTPTDVAILAHDVRSPLQTIAMCCDLLEERQSEAEGASQRPLDLIRSAVAQIRAAVDNVMDPAFEAVSQEVLSSPALLPDALNEAVERHRAEGAVKGVVVEHLNNVHASVEMENSRLQRVLANLLTNAVRHTPAGGAVRLSARPVGDYVWIFVTDTGVGIPPEAVPRLFDPGTPPIRKGGVGLRIVKRIMDEAGGTITVASSVGHGTTFTLILPRPKKLPLPMRVRRAHAPVPGWLTARRPGWKEDPCQTP